MRKNVRVQYTLVMCFYNIESRLEERFECRFQVVNSHGDCVMLRKSCIFGDMAEVHVLKTTVPKKHLDCMEVVQCCSHQRTLLCVVNSSQSLKKHVCETLHDNVVASFFAWMVWDVLKLTNSKKDQRNNYIFVAHKNGSAYDSQFVYRNAHEFFGSQNVNVLIHNNRVIELKVQVNTSFRMSMVYFKDSYKFMNLPLRLLPKSFNFHKELHKGFFPHYLNAKKNLPLQSKVLTNVKCFGVGEMGEEERIRFMDWHRIESVKFLEDPNLAYDL